MACYKPWQLERPANSGLFVKLPCGQCIGCRLDRQASWALRLTHESKLHDISCFVTLTYDNDHLPRGKTLVKRHVQLFMKRLRDSLKPRKVRFFACGEYGPKDLRPHYHIILFGWMPDDLKLHTKQKTYRVHTSRTLSALWQDQGFVTVTDVNSAVCAYTARYVLKKVNGDRKAEHYTRITEDGEMIEVSPEFSLMSRRPGIGHGFYEKFEKELRANDSGILNGRRKKLPAYYDKILAKQDEKRVERIKYERQQEARKHRDNNTPERLAVRETVVNARVKLFQKGTL